MIAEARNILLLLTDGNAAQAIDRIAQFDTELSKQDTSHVATDVRALWDQVGIAAGNMSNVQYFEDVKEELNRVTFEHNKRHPV